MPLPHLPDPATTGITPAEAAAWLAEEPEEFQMIDCREQDEWNHCRIDGATLIPLSQFGVLTTERLSFDLPIVVYCHHGMRSLHATHWLRQKGYKAWSLTGGIDRWSEEIDPAVPRY